MQHEISQENLQKHLVEALRKLERGDTFIVTRKGIPFAELRPVRPATFVPTATVLAAYTSGPPIDATRLRSKTDPTLE